MSNGQVRPNAATIAEEQEQVLRLKQAGLSHDRIAAQLDISKGTVANRLKAAIADHVGPVAEEYTALREAELNDLFGRAYRMVAATEDPDVRLKAIETCRRLNESRRKLRGADAPVRSEVQLTQRLDLESTAVAQAIITVVQRLQLPPERQQFALEAAMHVLDPENTPDPGQPPEEPSRPQEPHPMSANGKRYVVVKGERYDYAGAAPLPDPVINAEVISDVEDVDAPLRAEQTPGGPVVPDDGPDARTAAALAALDAFEAEFPELFEEDA
jgi:hypothetical protein